MFRGEILFDAVTWPCLDLLTVYIGCTFKSYEAIQLSGCFPVFECHKPYNAHRPQHSKDFQRAYSGDAERTILITKFPYLISLKE